MDARYPSFSKRTGPDLHRLIEAHGSYASIPEEAWQRFNKQRRWWTSWVRRGGLHGDPNAFVSPEEAQTPDKGSLNWKRPNYHWYTRKRLVQKGWE